MRTVYTVLALAFLILCISGKASGIYFAFNLVAFICFGFCAILENKR